MTCLAKGGPAEAQGAVQIGDSVIYVDDLDVRELMNNVRKPPVVKCVKVCSEVHTLNLST